MELVYYTFRYLRIRKFLVRDFLYFLREFLATELIQLKRGFCTWE